MSQQAEEPPLLAEILSENHIEAVRFAHRFKIGNFSDREVKNTSSNNFSPPDRKEPLFKISVTLKGPNYELPKYDSNNQDYVSTSLYMEKCGRSFPIVCKVSLVNAKGEKCLCQGMSILIFVANFNI